ARWTDQRQRVLPRERLTRRRTAPARSLGSFSSSDALRCRRSALRGNRALRPQHWFLQGTRALWSYPVGPPHEPMNQRSALKQYSACPLMSFFRGTARPDFRDCEKAGNLIKFGSDWLLER